MKLKDVHDGQEFIFLADAKMLTNPLIYRLTQTQSSYKIKTINSGYLGVNFVEEGNSLLEEEIILVDIPWHKIITNAIETRI